MLKSDFTHVVFYCTDGTDTDRPVDMGYNIHKQLIYTNNQDGKNDSQGVQTFSYEYHKYCLKNLNI